MSLRFNSSRIASGFAWGSAAVRDSFSQAERTFRNRAASRPHRPMDVKLRDPRPGCGIGLSHLQGTMLAQPTRQPHANVAPSHRGGCSVSCADRVAGLRFGPKELRPFLARNQVAGARKSPLPGPFSDRATFRSGKTGALHSNGKRGDIGLCPISTRRLRTVVFNNPFGSFQDSVAAAKEEREQLDRLLTISTPRERVLVAVIGAFSLLLAAWFFFGDVARNVTVDAILVEPGNDLPTNSPSLHALAWIEKSVESQVRVGLPAVVRLTGANGEDRTFEGEIGEISTAGLSGQLAEFALLAPVSVHLVKVMLADDLDVEIDAGTQGEIVIEVGRHSPIALLRMR